MPLLFVETYMFLSIAIHKATEGRVVPAPEPGIIFLYLSVSCIVIYLVLLLLVVGRRMKGWFTLPEALDFRITEYEQTRRKDIETPILSKDNMKFNKSITISTERNSSLCNKYGRWKVKIFPANPEEILFVDDFIYRKSEQSNITKLVYLMHRDKKHKKFEPYKKNKGLYLIRKDLLAQSSTKLTKLYSILPGQNKSKWFSIVFKFKKLETTNSIARFVSHRLDFYDEKISIAEKAMYGILIFGLISHLIWFGMNIADYLDVFNQSVQVGSVLSFPKIYLLPFTFWSLLFRLKKSPAEGLVNFIWKIFSVFSGFSSSAQVLKQ